ncbi:MAG: SPOR domain-containing protein [Gemmatimonadaceae bacterium]
MTFRVAGGRPVAWEDAGRQIATTLGSYSTLVVTSSEPIAAAHVAIGIARAESEHRRVVIGDLVGDTPPLRSLIEDEDPHGITDSFLYGVSMSKIERQVHGNESLFVMASGTDPMLGEEIFRSPRWQRLAAGFAELGTLLLLVAKSDSPGLGELIEQLDGAVVVKDTEIAAAPAALILARIGAPTPTLRLPLLSRAAEAAAGPGGRWLYPALGLVALLAVVGLGFFFIGDRFAQQTPAPPRPIVKAPVAKPVVAPPIPAVDTVHITPPANPIDSSIAAAFGVLVVVANTAEGANFLLRRNSAIPSMTVTPVPIGPERLIWYRVIAGAYSRRSQADSLLLALRNSGLHADTVLKAPLALLVDSVPTQGGIDEAVRAAVAKYTARGLPVYSLIQDDGGARLYAGAFEHMDQSRELTRNLRGAGMNPVLVYRTGRAP